MKKNSPATIACIGALAFIVAGVNHEVIGHGGMSLATGGHVALISAVCGYSPRRGASWVSLERYLVGDEGVFA